MAGLPLSRVGLFALFYLVALAGCKDPEKERALADAEAAQTALAEVRTELEAVKATLETTQKERDGLKAAVNDLSASLENLKTQLAAVTQVRDKLQVTAGQVTALKDQLAQLAQEKDAALAKAADAQSLVEKLKGELQGQLQKLTGLQEQNTKLQQAINELKKLVGATNIPEVSVP
jgi:chromosome segregation ATPase